MAMRNDDFIGMGRNPNPEMPDIPLGLGMALFKNSEARGYFGTLSNTQRADVIKYVQSNNVTGDDAKFKVTNAVNHLNAGSIDFLSLT